MAFNYWEEDEEEFTGEYVQESNEYPTLPHDTRVMALIDKAEWLVKKNFKDEGKEQACISLRFDIEDGEFKGQKIFKKFFIDNENGNEDQARKDFSMLMNIDANAGGKIKALKRAPDEEELQRYLINKSMVIVVGAFTDKATKKEQNYLMGVSGGGNKTSSKQSSTPKATAPVKDRVPNEKAGFADMDDDIPF